MSYLEKQPSYGNTQALFLDQTNPQIEEDFGEVTLRKNEISNQQMDFGGEVMSDIQILWVKYNSRSTKCFWKRKYSK